MESLKGAESPRSEVGRMLVVMMKKLKG